MRLLSPALIEERVPLAACPPVPAERGQTSCPWHPRVELATRDSMVFSLPLVTGGTLRTWRRFGALLAAILLTSAATAMAAEGTTLRKVVSLDGTWQVAEGKLDERPTTFDRSVAVPGLLDAAVPPFESPGTTVSVEDRAKAWLKPADPHREAFWYRRNFRLDGPLPAVALLKIGKAAFGTKVFVNGQAAGEHAPNFTPAWLDVRPYLKADGAENELIVRVGASLAQSDARVANGWDYEKIRYIPGIYDSVELILSGTPHVVNVQTVPDIKRRAVRTVVELANAGGSAVTTKVKAVVREWKSGRIVGEASVDANVPAAGTTKRAEVTVAIADGRLWSPEDPFLYELEVNTGADALTARFGLRSFTTDAATGRAILNGKPYFLRGASLCIFRFFEDPQRGGLPWDRQWVRTMHQRCKQMHWNALRYCIGFPPELWYEMADEEGILIQDEFPIWCNRAENWPERLTAEDLAKEFTEWMRERWNHACVAIWDAQMKAGLTERSRARPSSWFAAWTFRGVRGTTDGRTAAAGRHRRVPSVSCQSTGVQPEATGARDGSPRQWCQQCQAPVHHQRIWLAVAQSRRHSHHARRSPSIRVCWEKTAPWSKGGSTTRMLAGMTEFWRAHRKCTACCISAAWAIRGPSAKPAIIGLT